jgi:hypothetical protein
MNAFRSGSRMGRSGGGSIRASVLGLTVASLVGCDAVARPSDTEVRSCLMANGGVSVRTPPENALAAAIGITGSKRIQNPTISQVEWGQTITSQGGIIEMAVGAPRDTKIFPARVYVTESTEVPTYWVFKDSFGMLKCITPPGAATTTSQPQPARGERVTERPFVEGPEITLPAPQSSPQSPSLNYANERSTLKTDCAADLRIPDGPPHPDSASQNYYLEVLKGGMFALNREPITRAQLPTRLRQVFVPRPNKQVFLIRHPGSEESDYLLAVDTYTDAVEGWTLMSICRTPPK